jgi:hypothetical protein
VTATHPLLEPLSWLLGAWVGDGEGLWAGGFEFGDSLTFSSDGRPLVEFRQATHSRDGAVSHGEVGYLLVKDGGVVEMTVAEPSGITETLSGTFTGDGLALRSVEIGHTPSSKPVTATARRFSRQGDELVVEVDIGMNGEAPARHTRSVLRRAAEG